MTPVSGSRRLVSRVHRAGFALLLAALALTPRTAPAQPVTPAPAEPGAVLIGPASGRNVSAAVVLRARAFLLSALSAQCPACSVVDGGATAQAAPLDAAAASSLGARFGASVVLSVDVDHAPGLTRFTLTEFRRPGPDGSVAPPVSYAQVTPQGPEAMWPVINALVLRLLGRPLPPPPVPAPVAPLAPAPRPPSRPRFFAGAAVGILAQLGTAAGTERMLPAYGFTLLYRGDSALTDLRLEVATGNEAYRTALGLSYAFRVSPGWSLGLAGSWVWMNLGGRGASGPALNPMLGYLLTIPGAPAFRVEFGYALNLFKEQEMDRLIPGSDKWYWSHGPQLFLGLLL